MVLSPAFSHPLRLASRAGVLLLSECLALATVLVGSATPLCAQAVVVSGQSNLNSAGTFTGTPSTSTSITFSNQTYNPASFTVNSPANFGSLNDLSPTALTITNSGTTPSTLTLSGGTNSVPGTAPVPFSIYGNSSFPSSVTPNGDLLFVNAGSSLTIQNGTGAATLGLNLASIGDLDVSATGTGSSPVNGSLNISASISGTNGLTKTGAGTLTLTGVNTFTGGVNINQGQLMLDFSAAGAPTNNIINSANALTLGNTFTSSSGVNPIFQSFPTLYEMASSTASNTQTFGGLTLNAGANQIIARGNGTNNATIALGSITEKAGGAVNFSSDTNGGTGAGLFTTTSANDASGILGGFAVINATASNASSTIPNQKPTDYATVSGGNIVAYTGYTVGTLNGLNNSQLIGANPLTLAANTNYKVDGSSDISLTGTDTSGSTTVTGNTTGLVVGTGVSGPGINSGTTITAIGTGSFTISSAAISSNTLTTFAVAPNTTTAAGITTDVNTFTDSDSNLRVLTVGNGGTLRFGTNGGILATNQPLTITGGSITAGGPTLNTAGQLNLQLDQLLTINSNLVDNGTGPVSLVLNTYAYPGGRTALLLNGTNTYSGGTYINSGRLQVSNGNQLGSGAVYIAPQAQFFSSGGTYTNNFYLSGQPNGGINQQLGFNQNGALRINSGSTLNGTVTLLGDAGIIGTNGHLGGQITGNYNLMIGRPYGGDGAGGGSITFQNTSTTNLNNYGGNTIITEGSLNLGASNQIPDGAAAGNLLITALEGNATFNLGGFSDTVNGLSDVSTQSTTFTRTVTNSANSASTLTVGANNATATYNGSFTDNVGAGGTLSLAKIGSGTETFGGVDAASGSLTVSGGTLSLASTATVTKTTSIAVNTGGTLLFGATNQVASTPTVALAGGTISLAGLSGAKETFGALTLTGASTIDFGSSTGNTLVFSSLSLAAGATLNVLDWTGSIYSGLSNDPNTDPTQDRLLFSSLASGTTQAQLANINFYSDTGTFIGTGAQVSFSGTPSLEVVPVPESSTLFVGLGLLALVFGSQHQRLVQFWPRPCGNGSNDFSIT